jgi:hypothetical protein
MTFDRLRIYQNAIIGALGGLLGWALITLFLRFDTANTVLLFAKDAALGALVGGSIGLAIGVAEQRVGGLALGKIRRVLLSGAAGVAAGMLGLMIGEAIFLAAGGGVWPRAIGWALFGLLLGASQWPITGMPSKGIYGALGGLLGGLIGGSTYERLSLVLRDAGVGRDLALTVGSAIGLVILGACIGLFISLVEDILRRAWLRFIYGPQEGKTYTLDNRRAALTIGRSDGCDIMIRHDPDLQPVHAAIETRHNDFYLMARAGVVLLRNTQIAEPVEAHLLVNGDTVQVGKSRFIFQTGEE